MEDLAKIAYEAYAEARSWKAVNGDPLPAYEHLDINVRAAWDAASQAVAHVLVGGE